MTRAEQLAHYTDTAAALSQGDRIAQLEAQNAQLVEALNGVMDYASAHHFYTEAAQLKHGKAINAARAALAKAGASHV